jgi:hypothetical protein
LDTFLFGMPSRIGLIIRWGMQLNFRFFGYITIRTWCSFWVVTLMAIICKFIMQFSLVPDVCNLFASLLGVNINHRREVWIYASFSLLGNFHSMCRMCKSLVFASNHTLGAFQNVLGNFHVASVFNHWIIFLDWHRLTCGFASLILIWVGCASLS